MEQINTALLALRLSPLEMTLTHYSSLHRILLVGEGDFSFSSSLATAFGCADNIVSTSLDSREKVLRCYKSAGISISILERFGALVLHKVDATRMDQVEDLKGMRFDRIVFNFPHGGYFGPGKSRERSRDLVNKFLNSGRMFLSSIGEIHITHKKRYPYTKGRMVKEAEKCGLSFKECVDFNVVDYPGYIHKRGTGGRSIDKSFPLGKCITYKFTLSPASFLVKK